MIKIYNRTDCDFLVKNSKKYEKVLRIFNDRLETTLFFKYVRGVIEIHIRNYSTRIFDGKLWINIESLEIDEVETLSNFRALDVIGYGRTGNIILSFRTNGYDEGV